MDLSGLVLHDGDRVRGRGRVVATDEGTWFEPPLSVPLGGYRPGFERPVCPPSHLAVPVEGVDLDRLELRRETDGAVEGHAVLTGLWRGERLHVAGQELLGSPEAEAWRRWRRPPCPEPEGGWPEGDDRENLRVPNDLRASLPIVSICLFRPSSRQVVLVVAAEQPEEVEAALRPHIGVRLCVVASRWTRRQIDDLAADLPDGMRDWLVYQCGESTTADGQAVVFAKVARVLPAFAGWATPLPDGLLRIEPWLINVGKGCQMVGR